MTPYDTIVKSKGKFWLCLHMTRLYQVVRQNQQKMRQLSARHSLYTCQFLYEI